MTPGTYNIVAGNEVERGPIGTLVNVSIWSRLLTLQELAVIDNKVLHGPTRSDPGLLHYYPLIDESASSQDDLVVDFGSLGMNGYIEISIARKSEKNTTSIGSWDR